MKELRLSLSIIIVDIFLTAIKETLRLGCEMANISLCARGRGGGVEE